MTPNIREFDILLNQSREDVVVALSTGEEQDRTDSTITCRENNQIAESSGFLRSHFSKSELKYLLSELNAPKEGEGLKTQLRALSRSLGCVTVLLKGG